MDALQCNTTHADSKVFQNGNLVDVLSCRSEERPQKAAVRFLKRDTVAEVSFEKLDRRARQLAAFLQRKRLGGERALLVDPSSLDYVISFFGCLYAGVIAVPAFPATLSRLAVNLDRLRSIVSDSGARIILSPSVASNSLDAEIRRIPCLENLEWICSDQLETVDADEWSFPQVDSQTVAFLQYTSGSTRRPRGVMVSHGNLLRHSVYASGLLRQDHEDLFLSWMPLFHDFGLIGGVIHPLILGCTTTLFSPEAFIRRPVRWVRAISKYRATVIGGPDFGYKLCAARVTEKEKANLDLSCVKNALIGADTIHASTLGGFYEAFRSCGFRKDALIPAYGMAETTLGATITRLDSSWALRRVNGSVLAAGRVVEAHEDSNASRNLVGCGFPLPDHNIRIVDPETHMTIPPGQVGEVWISGPCVAQGYWENTTETEAVFHAHLSDTDNGPYLRTGDLGFLDDGELYIAGRLKDLIIIRGSNHFSQDIEASVQALYPGFHRHNTVAFGVEEAGHERLVIVQEIKSAPDMDFERAVKDIRKAILNTHGLAVDTVLFVEPRTFEWTSSGKLKRYACRQAYLTDKLPVRHRWSLSEKELQLEDRHPNRERQQRVVTLILDVIASTLSLRPEDLHPNIEWMDLGLDSLMLHQLVEEFKAKTGIVLEPASLLDLETVADLGRYLDQKYGTNLDKLSCDESNVHGTDEAKVFGSSRVVPLRGHSVKARPVKNDYHEIAVIGLGCRFPEASTPERFWSNLCNARDTVGEVPPERWEWRHYADIDGTTPLRWGATLTDVDCFDADFFGLSEEEAIQLDPQQRIFLEVVWEAIERAGYRPAILSRLKIGLFVGVSTHDYVEILRQREGFPQAGVATGNSPAFLANRVSYLLNFRGPSMAVDTVCSSSLVAVHLAVRSLRQGECQVAIAGGVNLTLVPEISLMFARSGLLASDGRCRAFDDRANGYARGETVAAVVLKPLGCAREDGDTVLAVIKGSAVGHDGNFKIGLTAPSPKGQCRVALDAYRDAKIDPESIGFIETHGTGTPLGDGIELQGLKAAFEKYTHRRSFCALGAVKTRVGNSEAASGITSFISAVLALTNREIPPNLNLTEPSRHIVIEDSPFYLNESLRPWPQLSTPRRAAVNSFGLGGMGAHVVLEEPPHREDISTINNERVDVFTLSARTESALLRLVESYNQKFTVEGLDSFHELCATANCGREVFQHRIAIVASSDKELRETMAGLADGLPPQKDNIFHGKASEGKGQERFKDLIDCMHKFNEAQRGLVLQCWRDPIADKSIRQLPESEPLQTSSANTRASGREAVISYLAQLFALGAEIHWDPLYRECPRRVVPLPTYPFERRRYWPDRGEVDRESSTQRSVPALVAGRDALEDFLMAGLAAAAPETVEEIDPETNLLDLGFDSIAATRLAFVLEQALGVRFSVIDLFEHHNVRALAKFLEPRIKEIPTLDDKILYLLRDGRRDPEEPFASTPLQQAYLSARALPRSIGGGGSQVSVDLEIPTDLDLGRLQLALDRLIERHPMLRTVFLKDGRQRAIRDVPDYPIEISDLRDLSEIEKIQRHRAIRDKLSNGLFDPEQWPLFYAKVTLLDKGSFHLLFGIDLLLVDFRSLSLMFCELRDLYVDPDRKLEALPVDFGDYMAALQELRESERYAIDRDWWRSRIAGFPRPPEIRRSGATYGTQRAALGSKSFEIPSQQWDSLKGQALKHKISPSVLLCAAFCETLHRWSGMEAFCLNLPIFDRYPVHKKIDGVVGPFNNNILLAVQWSSERNVWSQAYRLQSDCLEALEHRLFTGVEFARECAQHRKSLLDPIGPVVFTAAIHGEEQEGWGITCHGTSETPQVWLDCQAIEGQNQVMVRWDYDSNLFDMRALESNFELFQRCIAWMEKGASTEEPTVTDIHIRSEPESTPPQTLESIVSEQVKHTPHLRAVVCKGRYRTYADLEKHANQIANCLVARGVTAGSLVAVAMERSIEMVEAVLGTLKAGCAYVPIDPDYPTKRVEYLLKHSEAQMVLSQARLSAELPGNGTPVLDVTGSEVASMPDNPPDRRRSPDDLAYVIYTSGSTGTPKGVMISHGAAINTIVDINQRFDVTKFDRVLGFSSLSFDLSVWDIFGTLSTGGTLVILPRDSLKSPSRWFDLIEREGITIWNSVPTGMKMLLDFCEGRRTCEATTLRLVMLSGDWIPLDLPGRIKSYFKDCEVISLGGATEASIWSIYYPIDTVDPQWKSIPYGKPLANQSFHVLDNQLRPVPDGEVGELCIGGQGVAMGYYNEPQRTARSFSQDPSTRQILYRTGDLGRMMDDGNIEILGRVDSQVKIRGYRVELSEIEAVLQSHPAVDSGAITVRGEREAHELIAHFVPKGQGVSAQELRGYLGTFLPDYMIPQKFLERSSMPLNPNGKIDRGALNESST